MFHVKPCVEGKPAIFITFDTGGTPTGGARTPQADHLSTALWSGPLATARSLTHAPGRHATPVTRVRTPPGREAVASSTALASRAVSRETMH